MKTRLVCYLLPGLAVALAGLGHCCRSSCGATTVGPLSGVPANLCWRGVNSCSAASCHGGAHVGDRGSEMITWATCDPHARSFEVLFDERSKLIVKNLYSLAETHQAHAEKVTLCLGCHVAPTVAGKPGVPELFRGDGVSCESCHGPADKWLNQHYLPAWRQRDPAEKEALGFRPTKDLVSRAKLCVECHVGAGHLDVNHDLIAAGHPRLNFEFASYQAIYPKHWCVKDDKARYPDFEARSWALGQGVSAQAALNLLAYRAANEDRPWPEFAETNCYKCHQDLQAKPRSQPNRVQGGLPWNDWYYAALPSALKFGGQRVAPPPELDSLRKEMSQRLPNRRGAAGLATKASAQLEQWLGMAAKTPPLPPERIKALMLEQLTRMKTIPVADWDLATQNYLAAAALHVALKDAEPQFHDPRLLSILCQRRKELEFAPGSSGPAKRPPGNKRLPPD